MPHCRRHFKCVRDAKRIARARARAIVLFRGIFLNGFANRPLLPSPCTLYTPECTVPYVVLLLLLLYGMAGQIPIIVCEHCVRSQNNKRVCTTVIN